MAEELSPESKLYVKEEIEKVKKEFKEDLKEAQSKATKTFTTVALIIGLIASVGVYGLAKSSIKNTIEDELGKTTIKNLETDASELVVGIENLEGQAKGLVKGTNKYVKQARDDIDKIKVEVESQLSKLKTEQIHQHHQYVVPGDPNGFTWIGDIALIWGTRTSTKSGGEEFRIGWDHFPNDCFTVLTSLAGAVDIMDDNKNFRFTRLKSYSNRRLKFTFLAIGY